MPKQSLSLPHFDPHQLIAKTRLGALRPGETHSLSIHVRGLERALENNTQSTINAAKGADLRVSLNEDMSALLVVFPGHREHAVSIPLERPDLAIEFLIRTLSERRRSVSNPHFVGTAGAPTQADLAALAAATKVKAQRVGKQETLSLEDLGI
jgi:hypothetical protein